MSVRRSLHPDIGVRLRKLAFALVAIPVGTAAVLAAVSAIPVLIWGVQECRGGRAILASDYGPQVYTKVELVGRERVLVWDGYLTFRPVRVSFSTEVGEGHFEVTVTDRDSGATRTSRHGYVHGSGGTYYVIVTDKTALFAYHQPGYFLDRAYPDWVNNLFGSYYMLSDKLTCVI